MAEISIANSSLATLGATQVEPLIKWAAAGFPTPTPDPVIGILAVAVVAILHLLQKAVSRWIGDADGDGLPDPTPKEIKS